MSLRTLPTLVVLLGLVAGAGGAKADPAPEAQRPPFESLRTLHVVQEQIARGSGSAQATQAKLLAAIAGRFLAADPVVWRDPRNARAAVMYLFSGGQPAVVRTILSRSSMPREDDRLIKGALAYAEGQDRIARDLLQPIDPRSVPSVIGGHLALVEATLYASSDKAKASRYLDLARLLVPGTLVEEAALRRQIFLDTDALALPKFIFLSRQYVHRFRSSIYAENFKQHFAAMAAKLATKGDLAQLGMLDSVIVELPADEQRALYLSIAKAAIVQGQTEAARFAAGRAAAIAKASATDSVRAQLYIDAAMIVSSDVVKGVEALEAADRSRLSPSDADLRDAALSVAHAVQTPVPEVVAGAAEAPTTNDAASAALVEQAQKAITRGDQLLGDAGP